MESYSVQAVLSAIDRNFTSTMSGAQKTLSGLTKNAATATSSIMKIASGIGVFKAVSAGVDMLTSSLDGAIDRYDTLTKYPRVLKQLGYSTEAANKSTSKLKDGVQGLPTALDSVVSTAQRITVLTGNLEKSTDTTLALNNAFLASSASVADVSRGTEQYLQMMSRGTVDIMAWRTLQETMGYALRETSKELGIASGNSNELYDALQSGAITFDEFNDALIECSARTGGFAEMALEASKGIKTSWTNIQTAMKSGLEGTISAIDTMLDRNGLPRIIDMLDSMKSAVNSFFGSYKVLDDGTKQFNGGLVEAIANCENLKGIASELGAVIGGIFVVSGGLPFLQGLPDGLSQAISSVKNFRNSVMNLPTNVKGSISTVKRSLSEMLPTDFSNRLHNMTVRANGNLTQLGNKIAEASFKFSTMTGRFSDDAPTVWKAIDQIGAKSGKISVAAGKIGTAFQTASSVGIGAITRMTSVMSSVFGLALKSVGPAAILGLVVAGLGVLQGQFGEQINGILQIATTQGPMIIQNLINGIVSRIPQLMETGSQLLVNLLNAITANLPAIMQGGVQIIAALVTGIINNLPQIMPAAMNLITTFLATIIGLLPQVIMLGLQLLQALATGIANNLPQIMETGIKLILMLITGIITMLPEVVSQGWEIIKSLATGIVEAIPGVLTAVIDGIKDLFSGLWDFITGKSEEGAENTKTKMQELSTSIQETTSATSAAVSMNMENMGINTATSMANMSSSAVLSATEMNSGVLKQTGDMLAGVTGDIAGINSSGTIDMGDLASNIANSSGNANAMASGNFQDMASNVNSAINNIQNVSSSGLSSIEAAYKSSFSSINSTVDNGMMNVTKAVDSAMSSFVDVVSRGLNSAISTAAIGCSRIVSSFNSLNGQMYSVGTYAMAGLQSGIYAGAGGAIAAANAIANQIAATMRSALDIHSPSKVTTEIGEFAGEGPVVGLLNMISRVKKASSKVADAMIPDYGRVRQKYAYAGIGNIDMTYSDRGNDVGLLNELRAIRHGFETDENRIYHITVISEVDGREFARATAEYTGQELIANGKQNRHL